MAYVRGANPIWFLPDLSGNILNQGFYAFFLTNTLPYLPQNVYEDNQGVTPWANPIEFGANGTLPNNIFFDDSLVYTIQIRQGNTQTSPLIYSINNFVPADITSGTSTQIEGAENMIANPQFSEIFFSQPVGQSFPTVTYTTAGTYNIAPGWQLVLTGTGSTTVTQIAYSGSQTISGNPPNPYALRFSSSGWTSAVLQQTMSQNGAIWDGGGVSTSILAVATTNPLPITVSYVPNTPGTPVTIMTQTVQTGNFAVYSGFAQIPFSAANTTISPSAFVNYQITLPPTGTMTLGNIQLVGQSTPLPTTFVAPSFSQDSIERQKDHLFHVYEDQLLRKPKANLLTGWNFPLNPYQFSSTTLGTIASQCSYIADQTILYQENAGSNLQAGQAAIAQRNGLQIKAVTAATTTRFALIQYIDASTIKPYWSYILSSLVRARIFTTVGSQIGLKVRLIYRTTLPSAIGAAEPIASWAANSDPVFSAGWTAIAPQNDPQYILQNAYSTDETTSGDSYPAMNFESFQLPNDGASAQMLGIVVYTMQELNSTAANEDSVVFDRISLVPNKFAVDSSPETYDESLRKCQFYYETSYTIGNASVPIATATLVGQRQVLSPIWDVGGNDQIYKPNFLLKYNQTKRAIPVLSAGSGPALTIYSPVTGTVNKINAGVWGNGGYEAGYPVDVNVSEWTATGATKDGVTLFSNNRSQSGGGVGHSDGNQGSYSFQYVADARLGI